MSEMEREELATRVKAMTEEEIDIVLDNIPVEILADRLLMRVDELVNFKKRVMNFMKENL